MQMCVTFNNRVSVTNLTVKSKRGMGSIRSAQNGPLSLPLINKNGFQLFPVYSTLTRNFGSLFLAIRILKPFNSGHCWSASTPQKCGFPE